ncbi:Hypothetical protein mma_2532 [Janthinobacterium sp. Marseille]|nr:hypothetical protein [Janthinobacterium sp. Marseille]ABR91882.1 Hypothetical protein mma_2532 [Janthinobacterium sp. Marseille]
MEATDYPATSAKVGIVCFIKFFSEEKFADDFMKGEIYFNRLSYFKNLENENDRGDKQEGLWAVWQPEGMTVEITINNKVLKINELAGPITIAYDKHKHFHIFCMYAAYLSEKTMTLVTEDKEQFLQDIARDLAIDDRIKEFGPYAVVIDKDKFLGRLSKKFEKSEFGIRGRLVDYYDDVFNGHFSDDEIIFKKQKKFSYMNEYRLAFNSNTQGHDPQIISVGDLSGIAMKWKTSEIHEAIKISLKD